MSSVPGVGTDTIAIEAVTPVSGVVAGALPTAIINVIDFRLITTKLDESSDNTHYTLLPKTDIASVDLRSAFLTLEKLLVLTLHPINFLLKLLLRQMKLSYLLMKKDMH